MLQLSMADGGCADDKRAVRNAIGNGCENLRLGQNRGCSDGRASFAKRRIEWLHQAEMMEAEIA
jgi:hypothetical protein